MPSLVAESVIPKCQGRAYEVMRGQVLRVIAHEGKQVGDLMFLNLHNYKETFNVTLTASLNGRQFRTAQSLYTNPPFYSVGFTVENDTHGFNWLHGRCNPLMYERQDLLGHRSCQQNIVEALRPYGIAEEDIPIDTFNVFMVGDVDESGHYTFRAPVVEKGGYIDLRAHMDALVAISACPGADEINDYDPKALTVQVWGD